MTSLLKRLFGPSVRELPDWLHDQVGLKNKFDPDKPIERVEFVAFDTELTGLDFKQDSLISIGAVKLKGSAILPANTLYRLIKPECELKSQSVVVHELTHTELDCAEDHLQVIADFVKFIGEAVLIGHFIHIDLNFVNRPLQEMYGFKLQNRAMDTSTLHDWLYENDSRFARHFKGKTTKSDLFSLAKKYGVEVGKAHNAFSDAYMTAQLFQRFVPFLAGSGVKNVGDLLKIARP
jgi:DNA polymerase-3 subunit epsilon